MYATNSFSSLRARKSKAQLKRVQRPFRKPTALNILLLVLVFVLLSISLVLGLVVTQLLDRAGLEKEPPVCHSRQCVLTAAQVLSRMDLEVSPCHDFAQFACGQYINSTDIPEGGHRVSVLAQVELDNYMAMRDIVEEDGLASDPHYLTLMKDLYRSCMDEETISEIGLRPFLDSQCASDWPVLLKHWDSDNFRLNHSLVKYAAAGVFPLLAIGVHRDLKSHTEYAIYIDEPQLGIPKKYLQTGNRTSHVLRTYQRYLTDVAVVLGADKAVAQIDASAQVGLEMALAQALAREKDKRDYSQLYKQLLVEDLLTQYPSMDLRGFLQAALSTAGVTLEPHDLVVNMAASYLRKLPAVLAKVDARSVQNLFGYHCAISRVGKLTRPLRNLHFQLDKAMLGRRSRPPRWRQCVDMVADTFSTAMAKQFMLRRFSENARIELRDVAEQVRQALFRNIDSTASAYWTNLSRQRALDKLVAMKYQVGYPDTSFDELSINRLYEHLSISSGHLYGNLQSSSNWSHSRKYRKLREGCQAGQWTKAVYSTEAGYSLSDNQFTVPAGLLQPPVYLPALPRPVLYGTLGWLVAELMSQGFDDLGVQFGKDGQLSQWCDDWDRQILTTTLRCMADQFSTTSINADHQSIDLNDLHSMSQAFRDLSGLSASYRAFQDLPTTSSQDNVLLPGISLDNDQLFFVSWAQMLCDKQTDLSLEYQMLTKSRVSSRHRILETLKNSPEFAQAFKCRPIEPMNPTDKCLSW